MLMSKNAVLKIKSQVRVDSRTIESLTANIIQRISSGEEALEKRRAREGKSLRE